MRYKNVEEFEREWHRRNTIGPVGKEYDAAEVDDRRLAKEDADRREARYPDMPEKD